MMTLALQPSGVTLEWPLLTDLPPTLTVHDAAEADWLHELIGEQAHVALLTGAEPVPEWNLGLSAHLRHLAFGHWLRAWWPTSPLDGIAPLDPVLLDAETALLTSGLDDRVGCFVDAPDGAEVERLSRHTARLEAMCGSADPAVRDLVVRALDLLELPAPSRPEPTREDYALVAGHRSDATGEAVLNGTAPHAWGSVPAGVIDASEQAVSWSLDVAGQVVLSVTAHLLPGADPTGLAVRARVADTTVRGVLDSAGTARLTLDIPVARAWQLTAEDVRVDLGIPGTDAETGAQRASVRTHVADRLAGDTLNGPLYLAERQLLLDDW